MSGRPLNVIYTRLSEKGDNVALQEADCRRKAEADGVPIDVVLSDNGRSAWKTDVTRDAFEELLRRLDAGEVGRVYAWKMDRLCRDPWRDLARVYEVIRKRPDVTIAFAQDAMTIEAGAGMGEALPFLQALAANQESAVKSARVKRKLQDLAERGEPIGRLSWGLRNEEQRALIGEAARRVVSGESLHAVAVDWNARGLRGTGGSLWNGSRIGRILRRPQIAGYSVLNGEIVGRGQWEPAISEIEWKRLQRIFDGRRGGPSASLDPALLSGLVYCECGYRMTTRGRGKADGSGYRMYACYRTPDRADACRSVSIACHRLDAEVSARFLAVLQEEASRDALAVAGAAGEDEVRAKLVADLEADRELLADLDFDRYERRAIDRETYLRRRTPVEERIRETEKAIEALDAPTLGVPSPEEVLEAWDDATPAEQREWLRAHIDRVTVTAAERKSSGRVFDPNRVAVSWLR